MARRYDLENLIADLKAVVVDNLNTKITAMNTEKNDAIVLDQVNAEAYAIQSLNGSTMGYNPFILIGVEDIKSVPGQPPLSAKAYVVSIVIILADGGADLNIANRLFRYQRCLEEIFETTWIKGNNATKVGVSSLVPISFQEANTSNAFRCSGLSVQAVIG